MRKNLLSLCVIGILFSFGLSAEAAVSANYVKFKQGNVTLISYIFEKTCSTVGVSRWNCQWRPDISAYNATYQETTWTRNIDDRETFNANSAQARQAAWSWHNDCAPPKAVSVYSGKWSEPDAINITNTTTTQRYTMTRDFGWVFMVDDDCRYAQEGVVSRIKSSRSAFVSGGFYYLPASYTHAIDTMDHGSTIPDYSSDHICYW